MRVLIVASLFAPWRLGGAEVVAESSALALTELGHEVQVLTLSPDQETSQDHQDGYEIRRIPLVNIYPLQDMGRATTLQRVQWHIKDRWNSVMQNVFTSELKKIKPDVVLLHNIAGFSIAIYEALTKVSLPFVQVLHDHYFICLYSTMYRNTKTCESQCLRCTLMRGRHSKTTQLASGVIGVSNFILNHIKSMNYFSGVPSKVIHNLSSDPTSEAVSNRRFEKISKLGCTLGYLGILTESKGVLDLINVFRRTAGPFDRLRLAGHLDNRLQHLHSEFDTDPRIEYLGVVEREFFFSTIDCLVVPSRVPEAFGLVAQEAWFRGIPVLVSNQGALPETIASAPSAYVYDASNTDGLTSALHTVLSDCTHWKPNQVISASYYNTMKRDWGKSYEEILQRNLSIN
jgi:glycosyltransferase involved in cell wall biosynthesis